VHLFIRDGIPPDRLAMIGYGEYRPVADNATPEGRNANRRVLLIILADEAGMPAQDHAPPAPAPGIIAAPIPDAPLTPLAERNLPLPAVAADPRPHAYEGVN